MARRHERIQLACVKAVAADLSKGFGNATRSVKRSVAPSAGPGPSEGKLVSLGPFIVYGEAIVGGSRR